MREIPETVEVGLDSTHARSIDFGAAGLYLVGIQAIIVNIACAVAAILCCWLLPRAAVSAVRTLTVCAVIAFLGMFKAIRVGKVVGVDLLFTALQPLAPLYIMALVIEQLVHTCAPAPDDVGEGIGWRRILFQLFVVIMMISGFVRAATPNSELDFGFALTSCAMVAVALLPPPALPLAGPLCEPSSLYLAGERILRATFFSMLYCIHVYVAPPRRHDINELMLCVLRSSAASVWVLGAHPLMLVTSPLQAGVAVYKRFGRNECMQYAAMAPEDEAPARRVALTRHGFREFDDSDDDRDDADLENAHISHTYRASTASSASSPAPASAPPRAPSAFAAPASCTTGAPMASPASAQATGYNMISNSSVATAAMLLTPPEPYVPMDEDRFVGAAATETGFRDLTHAPNEPVAASQPSTNFMQCEAPGNATIDEVDMLLDGDVGIPMSASQLKSIARPIVPAAAAPTAPASAPQNVAPSKRLFSLERIPDRTSV